MPMKDELYLFETSLLTLQNKI